MKVLELSKPDQPEAEGSLRSDRDGAAELERLVKVLDESHVLDVLEWLGSVVIVCNAKRQVLKASEQLLEVLGVDDPADLFGKRQGEAVGCAYAAEAPLGCGTTPACNHCGGLRATLMSRESEAPAEADWKIKLRTGGSAQTLKLNLRAAPLRIGADLFLILVAKRKAQDSSWAPPQDWPERLNAYGPLQLLGVGGMGSVFLVEDAAGVRYALKTLRRGQRSGESSARFQRETDLALRLDHPHIVKTYEVGQTPDGTRYMVSEFCNFGSLSSLLQDHGPIEVRQAIVWLQQAVAGLDYSWRELGVVHRDIKPDNLLIDANYQLKIADFGLARADEDLALTRQGAVLGTPYYMSPEQWEAMELLDSKSDLYSLGATFYQLLSGRVPFMGATSSQLSVAHRFHPPQPLHEVAPRVPAALCDLIDSLLAKRPGDRPTLDSVLAQVKTIAIGSQVDLERASSESPTTQKTMVISP